MRVGAAVKFISTEDYILAEEASLVKHEYYRGDVFAIAGASIDHNRIARNTLLEVGNSLIGKSCEVFPSDIRIHIEANTLFTYPDLTIFCDDIERFENRTDTALNPTVIIEVLSKSTQDYDKGTKFKLYQMIPSLKEYITISSLEVLVEKYAKKAENEWLYTSYNKPGDSFIIDSIPFQVTISNLYRNVKFTE